MMFDDIAWYYNTLLDDSKISIEIDNNLVLLEKFLKYTNSWHRYIHISPIHLQNH